MVLSDKEVKRILIEESSKNPEKFFPIETLKEYGFSRRRCSVCGRFFWSVKEENVCGDCLGEYKFIGNPVGRKLDYPEVWKSFSSFLEKRGYTPIDRYPVVPRWREDVFFVQASIYDFQPHVVSGEVDPPANPLTVPQFCIRFNDLENVGITGRHYCGFIMLGQHAFAPAEKYDKNKYLEDIILWLTKDIKIPVEEIVFHEDAWAGGGNAGPSLEYFCRGLELGNMVFMTFKVGETIQKMDRCVLDMGAGYERYPWITTGAVTSYLTTFPESSKLLFKDFMEDIPEDLRAIMRYGSSIDLADDKESLDRVIRSKGIPEELKQKLLSIAELFRICDYIRASIVAFYDGAVPSNTGEGYYLRYILRKVFLYTEKRIEDYDYGKLVETICAELSRLYPEFSDKEVISTFIDLLEEERKKWKKSREKAKRILKRIRGTIDLSTAIKLYESHGVTVDLIEEAGIKLNFSWEDVIQAVRKKEEEKERKVLEITIPENIATEMLFYENWKANRCRAKIIWKKDNLIVLDKTVFYPEGGGQESDRGWIDNIPVVDVRRVGKAVVHVLERPLEKNAGEEVECVVDIKRRVSLTRHHTATHIILGAARRVLGRHVWQAGAHKGEDRAHIDITHYKDLTDSDIEKIERLANIVVLENRPVKKMWMDRNEAERKYGFALYQGGAVPGKTIRVVEIEGWDAEACCGTHVDSTLEVGPIKIVGVRKIRDGVYRIEFVAGDKAVDEIIRRDRILREICKRWNVRIDDVVRTVEKFFEQWKDEKKVREKLESFVIELIMESDTKEIRVPVDIDISAIVSYVKKKRIEKEKVIISPNYILGINKEIEGGRRIAENIWMKRRSQEQQ